MVRNRYLHITVITFAAILAVGFWYIQKLPSSLELNFHSSAADISQSPYQELSRGKVSEVLETEISDNRRYSRFYQLLKVRITSGSEKNKEVLVVYDDSLVNKKQQTIEFGQTIVVGKILSEGESEYVLVDRYRLPALSILAGLFFVLIVIFGRWRGLASVGGLLFSLAILILFIAPNILAGKNPVLVTLVGGGAIGMISMYLAHGFKQRTSVAVLSLLAALIIAEFVAYIFVGSAKLFGGGTQEAYFLQAGFFGRLDLQGLLFGGILIGVLGVLDDVTSTQAAAVEEIYTTDPNLSFRELFIKGNSVGKEHIASLVNTLVLAYAGASLPLFLLLIINSGQSVWQIINSEFLAEEIMRTLVGSMALVMAVPISTALAAYILPSSLKNRLQKSLK